MGRYLLAAALVALALPVWADVDAGDDAGDAALDASADATPDAPLDAIEEPVADSSPPLSDGSCPSLPCTYVPDQYSPGSEPGEDGGGSQGGCSCTQGADGTAPSPLWLLALVAIPARKRTRRKDR